MLSKGEFEVTLKLPAAAGGPQIRPRAAFRFSVTVDILQHQFPAASQLSSALALRG